MCIPEQDERRQVFTLRRLDHKDLTYRSLWPVDFKMPTQYLLVYMI
jgi:hypothetical protein